VLNRRWRPASASPWPDGRGDAAGDLDAVLAEELLAHVELLARDQAVVAVGLEVDLVHAHVLLEEVDLALQAFGGDADHGLRRAVDHGAEIFVVRHENSSLLSCGNLMKF